MHIEDNQFSAREKEVTALLLQGKSNKQIALTLGISESTVEYHLKNVYRKLQVNSRTEAVLRLGKSIGNGITSELGKSTVEINDKPAENGSKSIPTRRIPMNKMFYIIGGGLLIISMIVIIGLTIMPTRNEIGVSMEQASVTPIVITPTTISSSTPSLTKQPPTNRQEATYTNTLDSSDITLSLRWFYIDSTRVNMEFQISGFPIPDGYAPIRIIKDVSLHTSDGYSIISNYEIMGGAWGMGGGENNINGVKNIFNETVSFPIKNEELNISQVEPYILDVTVGGMPVFDEEDNAKDELLPFTTFHFEAKPSYVGSLSFVIERAANIEDKVVTLKDAEVNPDSSIITLCVYSPDKQQWLPSVYLLYKGAIFAPSGFALTNTKTELTKELCYRLDFPVQFDITDDPKQTIAVWVDKLIKDQPERLPNELISSAFQKLSAQGIEFSYVLGNHGASIEITKKPTELPEFEALEMIQDTLTEDALTSGVLIFDLK